jgi:serine/threonine protein kinase
MGTMEDEEKCHDLASLVGRAALRHSLTFDSQSRIMQDSPGSLCQVSWEDLQVGDLIGAGTFSDIREAVMVGSCSCDPDECRSSCVRGKHYVVKQLKASVKTKKETFEMGALGLASEAKLLPHLNHENIIRIHGITQGCISTAYLHSTSGYFLVLERLNYTLEDLLKSVKIEDLQAKKASSFMKRLFFGAASSSAEAKKTRLQDIAIPMARAMRYLHHKRVIYRDLKPANIGFDADGTLKLFDFGLAVEIVENHRRMSRAVGTFRYMSPENSGSHEYGFPADVYSFAILLWEVMTLDKPFEGMSSKVFHSRVFKSGARPKLDKRVGSKSLQSLIRKCWHQSQDKRLTFKQITEALESEVLV